VHYEMSTAIRQDGKTTSPLMWLRIVHSGNRCLHLALHTSSGACQQCMNE